MIIWAILIGFVILLTCAGAANSPSRSQEDIAPYIAMAGIIFLGWLLS